jgi:hypothetical protein
MRQRLKLDSIINLMRVVMVTPVSTPKVAISLAGLVLGRVEDEHPIPRAEVPAPTRLEKRLFSRKKSCCRVEISFGFDTINRIKPIFCLLWSCFVYVFHLQRSANFRSTSRLRAELDQDIEPINTRPPLLLPAHNLGCILWEPT